jgi:hypothetical protein
MPKDKKLFSDISKEELWDLSNHAIDSLSTLDLDKFSLTWARDSHGIEEVFRDADNGLAYTGRLPVLKNAKYNYRFLNGYHTLDCIPVDWPKKENKHRQVTYRYNSDWFRSENFTKTHDGMHLLFAGCSNSEGIGADIENTWSSMLYEEIANHNKVSGYFNLSQSGAGIDSIVHNITTYINKYGSPDVIFILLPNILRGWGWNVSESRWYYEQTNPWGYPLDNEFLLQHRKVFPMWAFTMNIFLNYCKDKKINVVWSNWDTWETNNITKIKAFESTYFPMNGIRMQDLEEKYSDILDRDDIYEVRDGHDGYLTQTHWYNQFKEELVKRGVVS